MKDGAGTGVESPRLAAALSGAVVALGAALVVALPWFSGYSNYPLSPEQYGPRVVVWKGLAFWIMPTLLAASWVAGRRIRTASAWFWIPAALFCLGAVASTLVAANRSAAVVRGGEMAGLWVAMAALVGAAHTPGRRRLLAAAVVASATLAAVTGIHQQFWGWPAAREAFLANPAEILSRQGLPAGELGKQLFLERFEGGVQAAMGHPNVLAAFLVLGILLAAGLVREKLSESGRRGARVFAAIVALMAIVMAFGLVLTQSRAGLLALLVGGWWLGVGWVVRRRRLRWALWLAPVVVGAAGLVAVMRSGSPALEPVARTLEYRLDYWQATWQIIREHPLTGVGLDNFGNYYLQYKLARAPEQISDPHNVWLSAWSQTGLAALAAYVALVALAVWHWLRRRQGPPMADVPAGGASLAPYLLVMIAMAGPILAWDYLLNASGGAAGRLPGAAAAVLVVLGTALAAAEDGRRLVLAERPLGALASAAMAAVVAFLLSEQVGTAATTTATLWGLGAVLAVSLGTAGPPADRRIGPPVALGLMVAAMVAPFAYVVGILMPVNRQSTLMDLSRLAAGPQEAALRLKEAERLAPWAWEPAFFRGQWWQMSGEGKGGAEGAIDMERAMQAYEEAIRLDPRMRQAYIQWAMAALSVGGALDDPRALRGARDRLAQAVALCPTDMGTRLRLADVLDRLNDEAGALEEYRKVLELDRRMPDPRRRLSDQQREAIEQRVRALEESLAAPAPPA